MVGNAWCENVGLPEAEARVRHCPDVQQERGPGGWPTQAGRISKIESKC